MAAHHSKKVYFFPEAFRRFMKSRLHESLGLALLAIASFVGLSLWSYDHTDPSLNVAATITHFSNYFEAKGAVTADFLLQYLGRSSYFLVLCLGMWGVKSISRQPIDKPLKRAVSLGLAIFSLSLAFASLTTFFEIESSYGVLANALTLKLASSLAPYSLSGLLFVTSALGLALFALAFYYASGLSIETWRLIANGVWNALEYAGRAVLWVRARWKSYATLKPKVYEEDLEPVEEGYIEDPLVLEEEPETAPRKPRLLRKETKAAETPRAKATVKPALTLDDSDGYALPSLDLLSSDASAKSRKNVLSQSELDEKITQLAQVLDDYGVKGRIRGAKPGPVVTLYELEPAPGIKSSRIIGLADDIARSMHAVSARIAVVPGKNVIGIELPNEKRQTVYLRELLESEEFENDSQKLALSFGKNISGAPVFADLARMPHMIVAGTTGSGKSVAVNAMILSLLYRHSPDTCRFILIDPKMLEFSMYNDIPHLLSPVVTDPKKAVFALKWAVREMEDRYRAMSHMGVRNIESYNQAVKRAAAAGEVMTRKVQTGFDAETGQPIHEEQPIDMKPLPYIVVVVDEMADLMMVAGKDIEAAVQRLAQMARAAGIHVIMATQRPSVDVITGTIKANFPTRISFQVTSKFDSRTILGEQGAEQLLGRGDMLFMEAGGRIQRVHGPFVSDEEVERIVTFLKSQRKPDYIETVCEESNDMGLSIPGGGSGDEGGDSLYHQALNIVKTERKASTSFIQRRLQIGYNRAARLIEQMEQEGIVSPANRVGKREILIEEAS